MNEHPDISDGTMSVEDAMTYLDLSRDYVLRLCRGGTISATQLADKRWVIDAGSLATFAESRHLKKSVRRKKLSRQRFTEYHERKAVRPMMRPMQPLAKFAPAYAPTTALESVEEGPYTPAYALTPGREFLQKTCAALFAFLCTFGAVAMANPDPVIRGFASIGRSLEVAVFHNIQSLPAAASVAP